MTDRNSDWSRRSVLAGSAAALLACAACSANSAGTPSTTAPPSGAGAETTSVGGAGVAGGAGVTGGAGVAGGAGVTGGAGKSLAEVSAIPAGSGLVAVGASGPVLLADSGGKVVAHTAVCTHQGATIDGAGVCPLHGSKFDVATGAVLAGPATAPLAPVTVTVSGGEVFLG